MASKSGDSEQHDEIFELVGDKPLGAGGFATTWRARVADPDDYGVSEVALKIPHGSKEERVLRKELNLNATLFTRLQEITAPNIARYLGPGVYRGRLVMVMEFVDGMSLREYFRTAPNRRLQLDECVELTRGVLEGLKVIHSENVLHRDLKPENILLEGRIPKLIDLGLSRLLGSSAEQ